MIDDFKHEVIQSLSLLRVGWSLKDFDIDFKFQY